MKGILQALFQYIGVGVFVIGLISLPKDNLNLDKMIYFMLVGILAELIVISLNKDE